MRAETIQKLASLNAEFYERESASFSRTRTGPWAGWERLLPYLALATSRCPGPRVLDVGCGNGRFGRYLKERADPSIPYLGVDSSLALLDEARARAGEDDRTRFLRLDVTEGLELLGETSFAFIAAFGIMHHLPSRALRRHLLEGLGRRLLPGGYLALAFWRFGDFARFRDRMVTIDAYNRMAASPIDEADLEPGDCLLRWGATDATVRYCHAHSDEEIEALVSGLSLSTCLHFSADGKTENLNDYFVLESRAGLGSP